VAIELGRRSFTAGHYIFARVPKGSCGASHDRSWPSSTVMERGRRGWTSPTSTNWLRSLLSAKAQQQDQVPGQALRLDACDRAIVLATASLHIRAGTYTSTLGVPCSYSSAGEVARYRDKFSESSALWTESPRKASNSIRRQ
jgi:hypothetical protein